MSRLAVELLLKKLASDDPAIEHVVVPARLVARATMLRPLPGASGRGCDGRAAAVLAPAAVRPAQQPCEARQSALQRRTAL